MVFPHRRPDERGEPEVRFSLVALRPRLSTGLPLSDEWPPELAGTAAAKSDRVSQIVRPVMDLMQTMPALVYLVPAITIFSVGIAPGAIATLIFAMPPGPASATKPLWDLFGWISGSS